MLEQGLNWIVFKGPIYYFTSRAVTESHLHIADNSSLARVILNELGSTIRLDTIRGGFRQHFNDIVGETKNYVSAALKEIACHLHGLKCITNLRNVTIVDHHKIENMSIQQCVCQASANAISHRNKRQKPFNEFIFCEGTTVENWSFCGSLEFHQNSKVLGPKGARRIYEVKQGNSKPSITAMFSFLANELVVQRMVVFPYQRLPTEIVRSIPDSWGVGPSDTGCMKAESMWDEVFHKGAPLQNINKNKEYADSTAVEISVDSEKQERSEKEQAQLVVPFKDQEEVMAPPKDQEEQVLPPTDQEELCCSDSTDLPMAIAHVCARCSVRTMCNERVQHPLMISANNDFGWNRITRKMPPQRHVKVTGAGHGSMYTEKHKNIACVKHVLQGTSTCTVLLVWCWTARSTEAGGDAVGHGGVQESEDEQEQFIVACTNDALLNKPELVRTSEVQETDGDGKLFAISALCD
ncbi:hypothetical protein PR048_017089 [Dryococelus australis]|uniref:Uncharacterized protein n=1 Tax=Dryococelus australis TaxID=614101 RepID=A0ABQ9H8L9_9NEOP|nr:hypothetical protein PR048_017089 [Dryococelus australis]